MLFNLNNKANKAVTKKVLVKKVFSHRNQKRVITKAAEQSAQDQRILVTKYNELVKQ